MEERIIKQVIVVNKSLNMRKGKMCAQVSHASMGFMLDQYITQGRLTLTDIQHEWVMNLHMKIVVSVNSEAELLEVIAKGEAAGVGVHQVFDSGRTEFHGVQTLTCAAFGPALHEDLHPITGHLPLI